MTTVNQAIEEWIDTKLAYEEAHAISSKADATHKAAKRKLVEAMAAEERTALKHSETGLQFDVRQVFSIRCNQDNEDQMKDWLHDTYGDIEEFTTQKLSKSTVTDRIKADIEAETLDEYDVPDFVGLTKGSDVWCLGFKQYMKERQTAQ